VTFGGRVEVPKSYPASGKCVDIRHLNLTAVTAEVREAKIIHYHQDNLRPREQSLSTTERKPETQ
jgi:hypothetical protein